MTIVVAKTPLRVSFFGGGTDYDEWLKLHGSDIISTTIDKYISVICMFHPEYYGEQHSRVIYRKIESVKSFKEIEHPVVKATLHSLKYSNKRGVEFYYTGDLPSKSGLGSSSAFAVSCINGLGKLKDIEFTKRELASKAIHLEQKILKETVGYQDQIACSFGGLNNISIDKNKLFNVRPIKLSSANNKRFDESFILVNTGNSRYAHKIADNIVRNMSHNQKILLEMASLTKEAKKILSSKNSLDDFGLLLNETWKLKRSLSNNISNKKIDEMYELGLKSGALGGKLLGAGSGGFMLFYINREKRKNFLKAFKKFNCVDLKRDRFGARVFYLDN